jgi:hypothetical protein
VTLAADQLSLLDALTRNGVRFVVVGGVAAQLRGWSGTTADLDIAVDAGEDNGTRINRALAEVGVMSSSVGGLGTSFETRHGRLEIVRRADGVGSYEDWLRRAGEMPLEHLTIVVASAEDVVRSKEAAGRDKDLAALPALREELGLSGS